ncbi:MAG: hypothetical protein ACE5I2_09775 [Anaerolineae bacterium]
MRESGELTGRDRELLEKIEDILANRAGERHEAHSLYGFCARLASAVPQANPVFQKRLESELFAMLKAKRVTKMDSIKTKEPGLAILWRGWRRRLATMGAAAVAVLVIVGLVLSVRAPAVSAQEILDRAAAAQEALAKGEGILYTKSEFYFDHSALFPHRAGGVPLPERIIHESYIDQPTGKHRDIMIDANSGRTLAAFGYDGQYIYATEKVGMGKIGEAPEPIIIYRSPAPEGGGMPRFPPADDFPITPQEIFEQARNDPNVEYVGLETRPDGRKVHVLRFKLPTEILEDGGKEIPKEIRNAVSTLYFDAQTYMLIETKITGRDGQEIMLGYHRELVNEILPADTPVAWDFNDLPGTTIVDDPEGEHAFWRKPQHISLEELVKLAGFAPYVLKAIPEGYELEITVFHVEGETPFARMEGEEVVTTEWSGNTYVIAYRNGEGDFLELHESLLGLLHPFDEFLSGDAEVYETASGVKLHFLEIDSGEGVAEVMPPAPAVEMPIHGIVVAPDGFTFDLVSNLSLERIKELAEELVLAPGADPTKNSPQRSELPPSGPRVPAPPVETFQRLEPQPEPPPPGFPSLPEPGPARRLPEWPLHREGIAPLPHPAQHPALGSWRLPPGDQSSASMLGRKPFEMVYP